MNRYYITSARITSDGGLEVVLQSTGPFDMSEPCQLMEHTTVGTIANPQPLLDPQTMKENTP